MAIHYVNMEQGRASSYGRVGVFSQAGEIGRQYGRRYLDQELLARVFLCEF